MEIKFICMIRYGLNGKYISEVPHNPLYHIQIIRIIHESINVIKIIKVFVVVNFRFTQGVSLEISIIEKGSDLTKTHMNIGCSLFLHDRTWTCNPQIEIWCLIWLGHMQNEQAIVTCLVDFAIDLWCLILFFAIWNVFVISTPWKKDPLNETSSMNWRAERRKHFESFLPLLHVLGFEPRTPRNPQTLSAPTN